MHPPTGHSQVIPKSFPDGDGTPGESGRSVVPSPYGERPLRDHVGESPEPPGMTRPEGMTWVVSWQTLGRPQEQTFDTELEAEQWAAKQINKQWTLTTPYVIWER